MRIGLNLLYLLPDTVGGTEKYAVNLIRTLTTIDSDNEYFVFLNAESMRLDLGGAPALHPVFCRIKARNRPARYGWEQCVLPTHLARHRLDLVHSLGYVAPLWPRMPSVVTIPDLNYIFLRGTIPWYRRATLRLVSGLSARRAARVITISDFSKGQLVDRLGIDPAKVAVTHLAGDIPLQLPGETDWSDLRDRYRLPPRYVLAIGGRARHKNIGRLLEAFSRIAETTDHGLVLVGHLPAEVAQAVASRPQTRDRVIQTGYVLDVERHAILQHADLFVLPSTYEGFGLPAIEAQASGVPIACSRAGALPETAGLAADYFDPTSVSDIAESLDRCLSDPALRARLSREGLINARRFSWERTARATLAVFQEVGRLAEGRI